MKNWLKGTNAAILSLAVIGIFIILTIFLHSLKGVQWDLTANKKFSLSDSTITTLNNLNQDVHVTAFTDPGQGVANRQVTDMLEEYHKRNGKFTWEEVDPKQKPTTAQKYQIDRYGTIVFESNGKTKNVYSDELFANGANEGSYTFSGEQKFTEAIMGLTSGEKRHAYLLTGHGEMTTEQATALTRSLTNENMDVKDLNLLKDAKIPDDAEALFVLSPQKDISAQETQLVQDFVKGKGKVFVTLDVAKDMDKWTNWNAVLQTLGVKNRNALVVESKQTLLTDPLTIVPEYNFHDITEKLSQQDRITVLPGALALESVQGGDLTPKPLLHTSAQAYAKTNISMFTSNTKITMDMLKQADADVKGPFELAYAVVDKGGKPKAIVAGNGAFLMDTLINQQGNMDFALNSVAWLTEQKDLVTIRPREEAQLQQVLITPEKAKLIFVFTVVLFPLLFLITGGVIWWRRRKG